MSSRDRITDEWKRMMANWDRDERRGDYARCVECGRVGWGMRPITGGLGLPGFECSEGCGLAKEVGDE